jgi:murein DD-endopeptidase MepM/ murein hydrolase activator NlpD
VEIRAAKVPHGPHRGEYALDEAAQKLIRDEWLKDQIKLCYPVPLGEFSVICQGLHETGGLAGNWAIDFCGPTGTDIMAVEDAEITKLSGKDPDSDIPDPTGTFGWSVHYRTSSGYRYFLTHLGRREALSVGQKVLMGTVLGKIGDQEFRPDHLHLGVTSPTSEADARKKIEDVSKAPMIPEL